MTRVVVPGAQLTPGGIPFFMRIMVWVIIFSFSGLAEDAIFFAGDIIGG